MDIVKTMLVHVGLYLNFYEINYVAFSTINGEICIVNLMQTGLFPQAFGPGV